MVGRSSIGWERDAGAATVELTLGVLPSHRRRGIGSRLLAAAEDVARDLGRSTVVAYSDHPDSESATRRRADAARARRGRRAAGIGSRGRFRRGARLCARAARTSEQPHRGRPGRRVPQ